MIKKKPNRIIGMEDLIGFGCHHDKRLWRIIRDDPAWVTWQLENNSRFEMSNEAYEAYLEKIKR